MSHPMSHHSFSQRSPVSLIRTLSLTYLISIILSFLIVYESLAITDMASEASLKKGDVDTVTNQLMLELQTLDKEDIQSQSQSTSEQDHEENSSITSPSTFDVNLDHTFLQELPRDETSEKTQTTPSVSSPQTKPDSPNNIHIETDPMLKLHEDSKLEDMSYAEIIVLNKITTKSKKITFKIGEVKFLNNVSVEVNKCVKNTDILHPNHVMLITVFDNKISNHKLSIFHGWVLSNNLSISSLEHPVYELIPQKCLNNNN